MQILNDSSHCTQSFPPENTTLLQLYFGWDEPVNRGAKYRKSGDSRNQGPASKVLWSWPRNLSLLFHSLYPHPSVENARLGGLLSCFAAVRLGYLEISNGARSIFTGGSARQLRAHVTLSSLLLVTGFSWITYEQGFHLVHREPRERKKRRVFSFIGGRAGCACPPSGTDGDHLLPTEP